MAANPNILTPSQLKSPVVDKNGMLTRQWYDFFGTVSDTIRQVIINTITVENQGPNQLFNSLAIDPAIQAANLFKNRLDFSTIPPKEHSRSSLLASDIQATSASACPAAAVQSPSSLSTWEPYTATVAPSAGSYTPTTQDSASILNADTVTVRVNVTGSLATTAPGSVAIGLVYPAQGNQSIHGYAIIGASPAIPVYGLVSGTTVTVFKFDNTNFALGSVQIVLTGVYQAA